MSSEAIIGACAALSALVTAVFAGMVSLRHARRVGATADILELRAYREVWVWAQRTLYRVMPLLSDAESTRIQSELEDQQLLLDEATEGKKELA